MKAIGIILIVIGGLTALFGFMMFTNDSLFAAMYQDFGIAVVLSGAVSIISGIGFIIANKRI